MTKKEDLRKRRSHYVRSTLLAKQTTSDQAASALLRAVENIYQSARPRTLKIDGPVVDYAVDKTLIDALRTVATAAREAGIRAGT